MADTSVGQVFAVERCPKLALPPYSNKMSPAFCTILYQDVPNSPYHIILTVLTILNPDVLNLLFHITPYHTVVKGPKLYNHTKMYNHTEHTAMWQTWSKLHSLTFPDGLFSSCGAFRSNFRGEEMSTTPAEQPNQRGWQATTKTIKTLTKTKTTPPEQPHLSQWQWGWIWWVWEFWKLWYYLLEYAATTTIAAEQ